MRLMTYPELLRLCFDVKTNDQVTVVDTLHKVDALLGDKPSLVM